MITCFFFIFIPSSYCMIPEFNDKLLYDIVWKGPLPVGAPADEETIVVTTKENEKYQCLLPAVIDIDENEDDLSHGPSPESLLADTLLQGSKKKCTFRLEPYWTYELCHGEKIRQYHEEKTDQGVSTTEFVLGQLTKEEVKDIIKELSSEEVRKRKVPKRKINDKETPYYSITMGNGTPCDLSNNKPRSTTVIFVCHPSSRNEILSVKEVTTCVYELVVLTPTLCRNPVYRVKTNPVNNIQCHSLDGSPRQPVKLKESQQEDYVTFKIHVQPTQAPVKTNVKPIDPTINIKFLKGDYCLIGGSGWWQYEFCYGKFINQFHQEVGKPNVVVKLGQWKKEKHLDWVAITKKRVKTKNLITHYYSGGDVCDVTGKPRHAQVNLICKEGSGQYLSIYMTEERVCEYIVGVESPILCPIIKQADESGLLPDVEKGVS